MGASSKIEWTNSSWNPIRARVDGRRTAGWHCEHVSEGCRNCYAESINHGFGTGLDYKPGNRDRVEHFLDEKMLLAPLKWRKPSKIFVCSTTDLFGDWVKDEWIDRMFAVMAMCPQHVFQLLTKRPRRMREYLTAPVKGAWAGRMTRILDDGSHVDATDSWRRVESAVCALLHMVPLRQLELAAEMQEPHGDGFMPRWPLHNVWLGVSCEDQATAYERIPDLLATPAAVWFVSVEPMLGPVDLEQWLRPRSDSISCKTDFTKLDWVICGGESGQGARPMNPSWARSLRDQCAAPGVPFFFKQQGAWGFLD